MFEDEKCPYCGSKDYETDDSDTDFMDDFGQRSWYCKCLRCKGSFVITYTYKLQGHYIEPDVAPTEPYQISMFDLMES